MIYKEFQGLKLSALGMGAMRLPVIDGDDSRIDEAAVQEMVAYAMGHGVNYYDTAWGYHNGNSELVMGERCASIRGRAFIWLRSSRDMIFPIWTRWRKFLKKQLEKCGVEYFDFYLFHNVCEMNIDAYLDPKYGIYDYLMQAEEGGQHPPSGIFRPWQL